MKRIACIATILLLFAVNSFAASSIVAATGTRGGIYFESPDSNMVVLALTCTAHTDGTFTTTTLSNSVITQKVKFAANYYDAGYYLLDVWAVNSATDDHTNAAVVTITEASTRELIGATATDTLALSQAASGVAYAAITRNAIQRAVTGVLSVAIADTGSTATVQTLYILLVRPGYIP